MFDELKYNFVHLSAFNYNVNLTRSQFEDTFLEAFYFYKLDCRRQIRQKSNRYLQSNNIERRKEHILQQLYYRQMDNVKRWTQSQIDKDNSAKDFTSLAFSQPDDVIIEEIEDDDIELNQVIEKARTKTASYLSVNRGNLTSLQKDVSYDRVGY